MTDDAIPYVNFKPQVAEVQAELLEAVRKVLEGGMYILGPEVAAFEKEFAAYCGSAHSIGVSNGTSALYLALRALGVGEGHEVITVSNSFVATASATVLAGARPVFVDIGSDLNLDPSKLEAAITPRTRAIIPVHLTGRPVRMNEVLSIARSRKLFVIEDAAQAVGASLEGRRVGSLGDVGCFSLHPLKNLHAYGDAGMITTNDPKLDEEIRKLRNIGLRSRYECQYWSFNCRLDELQAAMLRINLRVLDRRTEQRRKLAARYHELLRPYARVPEEAKGEFHVYQTYMVRVPRRDELLKFLGGKGVDAKVHYPVPIHRQEAASQLPNQDKDLPETLQAAQEILSLPLWPGMTDAQQQRVRAVFKEFYAS